MWLNKFKQANISVKAKLELVPNVIRISRETNVRKCDKNAIILFSRQNLHDYKISKNIYYTLKKIALKKYTKIQHTNGSTLSQKK